MWDGYAAAYRRAYPVYHRRVRPGVRKASWWVAQRWPRFKHLVLLRGWRHLSTGASKLYGVCAAFCSRYLPSPAALWRAWRGKRAEPTKVD